MLGNYPFFLFQKVPAVLGSLAGCYLVCLGSKSQPGPYDLYSGTLIVVCGLVQLGLTIYLPSAIAVKAADSFKLVTHNSVMFIALSALGALILLSL